MRLPRFEVTAAHGELIHPSVVGIRHLCVDGHTVAQIYGDVMGGTSFFPCFAFCTLFSVFFRHLLTVFLDVTLYAAVISTHCFCLSFVCLLQD